MVRPVSVQRIQGIAVITVDNPPRNRLTPEVLTALDACLAREAVSGEVQAVVLAARGRSFAGDPEPLPPAAPGAEGPDLGAVCRRIETLPKPVVAALHGSVLSGGLELALAAHYRIADTKAQFGFPGVRWSLSPVAGGTQRLLRLTGAARAADLLVSGKPVGADVAVEIGLVDRVAGGPLPAYTLRYVLRELRAGRLPPRPTSKRIETIRPTKGHLVALEARRQKIPDGPLPAPGKILDCLEAALLLPFEAGLSFERAAYEDLVASDPARALGHVAAAERRAARPPVEAAVKPRPIASVGILGAGLIGTGAAAACLEAGLPVTLVDNSLERLEAGVETVIDIFDRQVARRRMSQGDRDRRLARLNGQVEIAALAGADLVIEATPESADGKRRVLSALDAVLGREAILATTTSTVDVDGLAAGTARPDKVIGLHFLPPAHVIRLCEVVIAVDTSDQVIATAFEFVRRLGKIPVAAGVGEGYVAQRVEGALLHAAELTVAAGASIDEVDEAMRGYGFSLGPFEMADLAGLDLDLVRRARFGDSAPGIAARLMALGRTGRRAGRGYHAYGPNGRREVADPEAQGVVAEIRAAAGRPVRSFTAEDIRRRCLAAMANEGARLVEEGIALRPSDVDVAMIAGFGFPRYRGGPMMAADLTGLLRVKRDLDAYAAETEGAEAAFWSPAALFSELIKNGETFGGISAA